MTVDPIAETHGDHAPVTAPMTSGSTLGKYRLDRVLGEGGIGIVWAAVDTDLERPVAIKLLRRRDDTAAQRTRLLREARAMAQLKHPNVLTVYEVGSSGGIDYIAMELVDGQSMREWLASRPPHAEIVVALAEAGAGLAAAHAAGIVHRDFKPDNVLRDRRGHIYVMDFGLAFGQIERELGFASTAAHDALDANLRAYDSLLDSPMTRTGTLLGTPAYMAPEQFTGTSVSARSDQFAFCVTAWEALVGERPFRGQNLEELRAAIERGVGVRPPDLSPRAFAVLSRGLAVDPAARWPEMSDVLTALGRSPARPARWLIAGLMGLALTFGAVAYVATRSTTTEDCESSATVFASAWGPSQRSSVIAAHPGEGLAPFGILDDVTKRWSSAYEATCSQRGSPERATRLACLLAIRDEVARVTHTLARPDSPVDPSVLVGLATGVRACGR